jgi:antitoxin (DNA-binding transcriptional repressor) of toxin-antitoxin stability system
MEHLTISEARARLPEILDRVATGEEITITRHGRAAAVVLRPDAVRARRGEAVLDDARRIQEMLDDAATRPLPPPVVAVDRGEEMVKGIRAERDRT